jgi:hypothetical protein
MHTAPDQLAYDIAATIRLIKAQISSLPHDDDTAEITTGMIALCNLTAEHMDTLVDLLDPGRPNSIVKPLYEDESAPRPRSPAPTTGGDNIIPFRRQ